MDTLDTFFNNTTSNFYVLLTASSSILSGFVMFLEWLHYTYFGISLLDRVTVIFAYVMPFAANKNKENSSKLKKVADTKPSRNSTMLFRGAEYLRFFLSTGKEPLTDTDAHLTLHDLQSFFSYEGVRLENDKADELMQSAWKEKDRGKRMEMASHALEMNPECAAAQILLAEERFLTIAEVEEQMKQALKAAEQAWRASAGLSQQDTVYKPLHERNANLCAYAKLRLATCARKLGKSYSDVHQWIGKLDDASVSKSTMLSYTMALLKAKAIGEKFSPDLVSRRGTTQGEMAAVEAVHRAVELNPHVPKYLLELKGIVLPPEHFYKRGDSEALVYTFHHLHHWKRVEGALSLLGSTWEGTFRRIPFPLERGHLFHPYPSHLELLDRQLLPAHHEVAVFPPQDTPSFMVFTGVLCFSFMTLTIIAFHFPQAMTQYAKMVTTVFLMIVQKVVPFDVFGLLM
ncbi:hypothetical protein EMCRGX_G024868 [Ephydatia muelleri]